MKMFAVGVNMLISARVPARIEIHPGISATSATTCAPQRVQKARCIGWPLPPGELKRVSSPMILTLSVLKNMMGTNAAPVDLRQSTQ